VKNFPVIVIIDSKGNNLYENINKSLKEVQWCLQFTKNHFRIIKMTYQ
jgi:hypothetical protein